MFLLPLLYFCLCVNSENWAYLLAGSKTWYNYRHQSDVAHAHRYFQAQNFDMDRVIITMYDDIARNPSNKYYNNLKNFPHGKNNYKDIRVDYTGNDVTVNVFLASLAGNLSIIRGTGTGRYLNVTKDDTVFIYLTDHGAKGIFSFPREFLTADVLVKALKDLKKRCKYVLVFIEACESGSLVARKITNNDKGIFVITASNSKESSYATYYDGELNVYLGDEFSVNFLEYLDATDQSTHTLRDLFKHVKNKTAQSHVSPFGDRSMLNLNLSTFFKDKHYEPMEKNIEKPVTNGINELVAAPDVDVVIADKFLLRNPKDSDALKILKQTEMINAIFYGLQSILYSLNSIDVTVSVSDITGNQQLCYEDSLKYYYSKMSDSIWLAKSYQYLGLLQSACAQNIDSVQLIDVLNKLIDEAHMEH